MDYLFLLPYIKVEIEMRYLNMNDKDKQDIALLKFQIISPLISEPDDYRSNTEFFRVASCKTYKDHSGKDVKFSEKTICGWYYDYKRDGFDALIPKGRSDLGTHRKLDDDIEENIRTLKTQYPRLPSTAIRKKLIADGIINEKDVSLSTVTRFVNKIMAEEKIRPNKDMRRYERAHINEVWCGDTSYGPYLRNGKTRTRTYIIALLDDASRMIVSIDIFTRDNYLNLMSVIQQGVKKYGVPSVFNFDNGANYKSGQMKLLAARIGSAIRYNKPYGPQGKAKLERWFRTMKDHWMSTLSNEQLNDINLLRESLLKYVNEYNHSKHSSLKGLSPKERYFQEANRIRRISDQLIHDSFLLEVERKVSTDCVVSIDSVEYEVHYSYARKRIKIRYNSDLSEVYVVDGDNLVPIKLLNKIENSTIHREKVKFYEPGGED